MSIKKQKKAGKELLQAANKVYHYRRDVLSEARLVELDKAVAELDAMLRDPAVSESPLEACMNRLDTLLRKIGGKIYPKTFWSDNNTSRGFPSRERTSSGYDSSLVFEIS